MEGGHDELDFEEDFADDDERMEMLDRDAFEDEETRELEQRLREEMRRAEADGAEEEEPEENRMLTGTGKQMKKMMKLLGQRDGNEAYDSDEENPYASDDSGDVDMAVADPEKALEEARQKRLQREKEEGKAEGSKSGSQSGSRGGTPAAGETEEKKPSVSRAQSPAVPSPGRPGRTDSFQSGKGHASVAQRATSPSRTVPGKPSSRPGSRATSPGPSSLGPGAAASNKRKPDDRGSPSPEVSTEPKRPRTSTARSASPSSPGSGRGSRDGSPSNRQPANEVEAALIEFLRNGKYITTQDVVQRFKGHAKDEEGKKRLTQALKRVATSAPDPRDPNKRILVLKEGW